MTQLSRLARIIGLLAVTAALAACSAVKLGYNNFDEVAYWWLDGYVDFTDEQTPRIREDLSRLQAWHRAQELPHVEALLRDMEALAAADISADQACAFVPRLFDRLNALAQRAEPALVTLAVGLAPEQIAHLEQKYSRNNAQFRKEWVRLPAAELQEKRFKQYLERSEMIYGRLDEAQRAVTRRQTEKSIYDAQRILAERQRRQQDALRTLRRLAEQPVALDEARTLLRAYVAQAQVSADAAYRSYQQALIDEGCRNAAALHNSTSPAQREAAARRLRAYQRDMRELSAQP